MYFVTKWVQYLFYNIQMYVIYPKASGFRPTGTLAVLSDNSRSLGQSRETILEQILEIGRQLFIPHYFGSLFTDLDLDLELYALRYWHND
jgi:hypothetical protein